MKIRVYGKPEPQGSVSAFAVRKKGGGYTGKVTVTSDNKQVKPWRQAIIDECRATAVAGPVFGRGVPVAVDLTFWLARPKGHYGTGRNAEQVRDSAPLYPVVKPDGDKLDRAVLDALTAAGIYHDDAQVIRRTSVKYYAFGDEAPGALIEVTRIG